VTTTEPFTINTTRLAPLDYSILQVAGAFRITSRFCQTLGSGHWPGPSVQLPLFSFSNVRDTLVALSASSRPA